MKYGIFFDDDYDYLQHLREPGDRSVHWEYVEPANMDEKDAEKQNETKAQINLPSSVFASEFEEEEGMLRKAAPRAGPRLDWDPDIVAAMDDDFDFNDPNNQLEDDFVSKLVSDEVIDEADDDGEYSDIDSDFNDEDADEFNDKLPPLRSMNNEETKSRFTEYSMSSSVIRRNEQLSLLDDRFEKFYEKYDDAEIGPMDMDEIEGNVELKGNILNQCLVEFEHDKSLDEYNKEWDKERIKRILEGDSSEEEMIELEVEDEKKKKWYCESILSTYSNCYNHPKLIEENRRVVGARIEIDPKTGVPINVLNGDDKKLTLKNITKHNAFETSKLDDDEQMSVAQSLLSTLSVLSIRPKDETPEERIVRKKLLKEYRAERRLEKKASRVQMKESKKHLSNVKINNQNNVQGNRIV